jgi:calcineurin-like phosphoesterase family protein
VLRSARIGGKNERVKYEYEIVLSDLGCHSRRADPSRPRPCAKDLGQNPTWKGNENATESEVRHHYIDRFPGIARADDRGVCDLSPDGWQEAIIDNWNCLIHPEEIVLHVVDLALGKKENIESLVPLLNGKLYLMRGNHDQRSNAFYQQLGIIMVSDPYPVNHPSGLQLIFSHRSIVPLNPGVLNLHGHIHNSPAPELGAMHLNLYVEVRDYHPWRLGEILTPLFTSC